MISAMDMMVILNSRHWQITEAGALTGFGISAYFDSQGVERVRLLGSWVPGFLLRHLCSERMSRPSSVEKSFSISATPSGSSRSIPWRGAPHTGQAPVVFRVISAPQQPQNAAMFPASISTFCIDEIWPRKDSVQVGCGTGIH